MIHIVIKPYSDRMRCFTISKMLKPKVSAISIKHQSLKTAPTLTQLPVIVRAFLVAAVIRTHATIEIIVVEFKVWG